MNTLTKLGLMISLLCGTPLARASDIAPRATDPTAAELKPSDSVQIRNKQFGDLLRPEDANHADGTPIVLYPAQPWKCMTWKLLAAGDTTFCLRNHFTSKTIAPAPASEGTNQPVRQIALPQNVAEQPAWIFTRLPDGSYKIANAKSGEALTAVPNARGGSPRIVIAPWQNRDAQKWEVRKIDPRTLTM